MSFCQKCGENNDNVKLLQVSVMLTILFAAAWGGGESWGLECF